MTIAKHVADAAGNEMKTNLPAPVEDEPGLAHQQAHVGLKGLEDAMFEKAMEVTQGAMSYADMPFDAEGPPKAWVKQLGKLEAWRRFRMVKAGQLPSSHAPAGLKVATAIAMAGMKTRAVHSGPQLAINIVQLTQEKEREYPVQVIDE